MTAMNIALLSEDLSPCSPVLLSRKHLVRPDAFEILEVGLTSIFAMMSAFFRFDSKGIPLCLAYSLS